MVKMTERKIDAAQSALLVMDFQIPIVERYAAGREKLLAATAARSLRLAGRHEVIYVVVGFRPGLRISPQNRLQQNQRDRRIRRDIHPHPRRG